MNLERMIRTASELPEGSSARRDLIAAIKVAVSQDTVDFIEWVLATQDRMTEAETLKFLETKLGHPPTPAAPKGEMSRTSPNAPLVVGEKVMVDRNTNTNTLNTDACEGYHNRVGQIDSVNSDGVVVAFYRGNADSWADELTGEKQLFIIRKDRKLKSGGPNVRQTGGETGLLRWTPKSNVMNQTMKTVGPPRWSPPNRPSVQRVLFECVYLRGGTSIDPRRTEQIQEYVERGVSQGSADRSRIYYTGLVGRFALNKQGRLYFSFISQQRDTSHTMMSPTEGKLLYIGVAGKRPGGWKEEAVNLGLRAP